MEKKAIDDQIIANQVAGMPLEEAIFQAGYTAGVKFEKGRAPTGVGWVKGALPKIAGDYYCKCKVDGEDKKLIVEFDKNGQWGEAPGYDYYETFDITEWLDESGTANAPNPDELWDEFSEEIPDDIDGLTRWAGSTVMSKEGFRKMMDKLKQSR